MKSSQWDKKGVEEEKEYDQIYCVIFNKSIFILKITLISIISGHRYLGVSQETSIGRHGKKGSNPVYLLLYEQLELEPSEKLEISIRTYLIQMFLTWKRRLSTATHMTSSLYHCTSHLLCAYAQFGSHIQIALKKAPQSFQEMMRAIIFISILFVSQQA